uniref:BTB domain-containing protein n=1 Tax=Oryza barthii TaxID=65489 RepID=A0A0D3HP15_9ORYZ
MMTRRQDAYYRYPTTSTIVASAPMPTGHHVLRIDGYSLTKAKFAAGECDESCSFIGGGHAWRIKYYPNGTVVSGSGGFVSLMLSLDHQPGAALPAAVVKARFAFSLLDMDGEPVPSRTYASDGVDIAVVKRDGPPTMSTLCPVEHDMFRCLLDTGDDADVAFRAAGGETIAAHRRVLERRAPELAKLCRRRGGASCFMGLVGGHIDVGDMDAAAFKALLHFVYTDTLPETMAPREMPAMAPQLIAAARKYGLDWERLRLLCEDKAWGWRVDDTSMDTTVAAAPATGDDPKRSQRRGNALYFRMVGAKATLYCYKIGFFSPHVLSISVMATYTQLLFLARKGVAMRAFESFTGRHDDRRLAFIKDGVELRAGLPPGPALGQYERPDRLRRKTEDQSAIEHIVTA